MFACFDSEILKDTNGKYQVICCQIDDLNISMMDYTDVTMGCWRGGGPV